MTDELLLIDLSAIGHQIWHVSGNEPDPSYVSTQIIARIRALAAEHPHAAICCDSGRSFRADIDPTYKANRDTENRAPLRHQMDIACETLKRDGFPVWRVQGAEADDVIASAVRQTLAIDGATVLIASADKDLLQLVCDGVVRMKKITDGTIMDAAAVVERFKVTPAQMHDYLCLVGDTSDNIVGAKGIGGVTAAKLLNAHGSIARVYEMMRGGVVAGMTPAIRSSLVEFEARWPIVSQLIDLKTDLDIPFSEIASERVARPMVEETGGMSNEDDYVAEQSMAAFMEADEREKPNFAARAVTDRELTAPESALAAQSALQQAAERINRTAERPTLVVNSPVPVRQETLPVSSAPVDFSQQLEPRNMQEAVVLADRMFQSRLFGAYGTPQAVLATVLAGRELGIPAMASLRAFHIIEGKPTLSAGIIQSLVVKSGKAKYFRCSERTNERATFVTQRGDDPEMALTFTVEDARLAFGFTATMHDKSRAEKEEKWAKSGWGKNPADNCVARASSKLARLVYPDVVSGLYAPEEME